jgi:hypothetical protein
VDPCAHAAVLTDAFSIGPLTNIEFIVGWNFTTDNTTLGSAKRAVMSGPQFDFQTPYKLPPRFVVFGGYRWWKNKFGIKPHQPGGVTVVGTLESTWLAGAAVKF